MPVGELIPKVVSVNVGRPQELVLGDRLITTSIFKTPVDGPVRVNRLNIEGDQQSDLRVHGGVRKAVYVYPSEHYEFWRAHLQGSDLEWGAFGENITTLGLIETTTHIGDTLRIGTAILQVTQPREPCFKLALKFGQRNMIKRFLESQRSGFYLRVVREGQVCSGDDIALVSRDGEQPTVAELFRRLTSDNND